MSWLRANGAGDSHVLFASKWLWQQIRVDTLVASKRLWRRGFIYSLVASSGLWRQVLVYALVASKRLWRWVSQPGRKQRWHTLEIEIGAWPKGQSERVAEAPGAKATASKSKKREHQSGAWARAYSTGPNRGWRVGRTHSPALGTVRVPSSILHFHDDRATTHCS